MLFRSIDTGKIGCNPVVYTLHNNTECPRCQHEVHSHCHQAFWGALGGITFSSVMNKAGEFINKRLDKDWLAK